MLEEVRGTLERFGVRIDTWFSERAIYRAARSSWRWRN